MTFILICIAVMITVTGFPYPVGKFMQVPNGGLLGWDDDAKLWRPIAVTASGSMAVDSDASFTVDLGDVSLESIPSFQDSTGTPTRALTDSEDRAVVNLGSETVGIVSGLSAVEAGIDETKQPVTELQRSVVSLTASTVATISSSLTGSRKFIQVTTMDNTKEFWMDFDSTAAINASLRVYGGYYLEIPKDVDISVIASESLDLFIIEGGF
jgi:hypothetical protein